MCKEYFFLVLLSLPLVAQANTNLSIEEFLQNLSTVPEVVTRKDPFVALTPPFTLPEKAVDVGLNAPVLERYPVAQYGIVATLLGDQYPRALVKLPEAENGKVLIVKEKDKLGSNGGVIAKILKDGLLVMQSQKSPLGFVEKTQVMLKVGSGMGGAQDKK